MKAVRIKMLLAGLLILCPAAALAGEECSAMGGVCRGVCGPDEEAEVGAFLDCTEKQECCVKKTAAQDGARKTPREEHPGGKSDLPSGQKAK